MRSERIMLSGVLPRPWKCGKGARNGRRTLFVSCFVLLGSMMYAQIGFAQSAPSEHESHHPPGAPQESKPSSSDKSNSIPGTAQVKGTGLPPPPPTAQSGAATTPGATVTPGAAGMPGMPAIPAPAPGGMPPDAMGGMGKMMEGMMSGAGCCGGVARVELYPFLMSLPSFTPEQRAQVQALSTERMVEGKALVLAGQQRLSASTASGDHDGAAGAILQLRDGLGRIGSGMAAHKLLQDGTMPRVAATRWFKSEMNIDPAGPLGTEEIAPMHLITMALLVAFAIAMVAMYFFKMRRTAALFGRIEAGAGKPPPGSAPILGVAPPPSAPNLPGSGVPTVERSTPTGTNSPAAENAVISPIGPKAEVIGEQIMPLAAATTGALLKETLPTIPNAKWHGMLRVLQIIIETPSVKTIRLGPAVGEAKLPFTFLPGQFLNVSFSVGGARMNRSYSISSSPTEREYIDLTIKREARGAVSRHIDDLLRVDDVIEAGGPVGRFTFNGTEANSIVLISGGVGITPMMSISRYLTQQLWPNEIFFIYACRSPADFIFAADLAELERQNPKLHVTVVMEHPEGTTWQGPTGRLSRELLAQTVPDITARRIHICGPPVMMDAVRALLADLKVPAEQVKTEDFGTAAPIPSAGGPAKFTTPATGPLVNFSNSNKSSKIHVNQTLLELSEELGIGIEFSCRVGTCGVCKVKLTEGEVDMAIDDGLDEDDKAKGIILACQAKPKSAVNVEA